MWRGLLSQPNGTFWLTQSLTNLELENEFPFATSELDRERFLRQSGSSTDHSLQQFFALLCLRLPRWTTSQKRFGLETLGIPLPTFSTHSFEVSPRLCSAFRCLQRTGSLLCKEVLHPRFQIVPPMYYVCHQQDLNCTPAFCWDVITIVAVGSLDTRYLAEPKATIIHRTTPESPLSFGCLGS